MNSTIAVVLFTLLLLTNCVDATGKSNIWAGTAKVCYTPESIDDSLILDKQFIRVIAFSDGLNEALLIMHETKWTSHAWWEEITSRIKEETGIPPEYVILSAVHTHSGAPRGEDFDDKLIHCVKEALSNLKPARVGAGKGESLLNMNRRTRASEGGIWLGKNPNGPCDHDVDVLRVDDQNGNPLSIMVNWAAHAVINWPKPKIYSGDWPGATAKFIEEAFQNQVTAPISIGASGDINPVLWAPFPGDKKEGIAITGIYLGEESVKVAKEIVTIPTGEVTAVQRFITLPGKKKFESRMPDQVIVQGEDLKVRLTALKVGGIVFAGISGELMTEIGMDMKKLSPYKNTFIITHCNGSSGYLVTDEALKEGGYEPRGSRSMPGCEKVLVDNMIEMINEL